MTSTKKPQSKSAAAFNAAVSASKIKTPSPTTIDSVAPITSVILHPTHSNPPSTIQLDPTISEPTDDALRQMLLNQIATLDAQISLLKSDIKTQTPASSSSIQSPSFTLPASSQPQSLSQKIAAADAALIASRSSVQTPQPSFFQKIKSAVSSSSPTQKVAHNFKSSTTLKSAQSKKSRMLAKLRTQAISVNFALHSLSADPLLASILTEDDIIAAFYNTTHPNAYNPNKPKSTTTVIYLDPSDLL